MAIQQHKPSPFKRHTRSTRFDSPRITRYTALTGDWVSNSGRTEGTVGRRSLVVGGVGVGLVGEISQQFHNVLIYKRLWRGKCPQQIQTILSNPL